MAVNVGDAIRVLHVKHTSTRVLSDRCFDRFCLDDPLDFFTGGAKVAEALPASASGALSSPEMTALKQLGWEEGAVPLKDLREGDGNEGCEASIL